MEERLKRLGRKSYRFDKRYGNGNGGIKEKIQKKLFSLPEVVTVGSGQNQEWKTGKYGGCCIRVQVQMKPEEFKSKYGNKYPQVTEEPYLIIQCSSTFKHQCRIKIKRRSSWSDPDGTLGLIASATENDSNETKLGITAFHVVSPKPEESTPSYTRKEIKQLRKEASLFNNDRESHYLFNRSYTLMDCPGSTEGKLCYGFFDDEIDVGVLRLQESNKINTFNPAQFHWLPQHFENDKFINDLCLYHNTFFGENVKVFHNGSRTDNNNNIKIGRLKSTSETANRIFANQIAVSYDGELKPDELEQQKAVDLDLFEERLRFVNAGRSQAEDEHESDSEDEFMDDDEDEAQEENEIESGNDSLDIQGLSLTKDANSKRFTQNGDSGCVYYLRFKQRDGRIDQVPVAVHRGALENSDGDVSYGSCLIKIIKRLRENHVQIRNDFPAKATSTRNGSVLKD